MCCASHHVLCALYAPGMYLIPVLYHVALPYYVSISCCVSVPPCVCTWGLAPSWRLGVGISAPIFCLPAPQLCCTSASCQHLCLGTRAATLLMVCVCVDRGSCGQPLSLPQGPPMAGAWPSTKEGKERSSGTFLRPKGGSEALGRWRPCSTPSPVHIGEGPAGSFRCLSFSFRPSGRTGALLRRELTAAQGISTGKGSWAMGRRRSSAKGVPAEVTRGRNCAGGSG